ncbi:uncharacterized protein LOC141614642 [Silene latifolia]|uniref:uncharacterized protein LOC141614642 n=1 Tax=Silene latifolia TaxID=37657 RepID=UPI003D771028
MVSIVGIPPLPLEPLVEDVSEEDLSSDAPIIEPTMVLEAIEEGPDLLQFTEEKVQTKAAMDAVLKQWHFLFDNKPLIVKPWSPDIDLVKHEVQSVPVRFKLHRLPLKFWGNGIPRIFGLLGEFIKCDQPTNEKIRIGYARVMIELVFGNPLLDKVKFLDEHGEVVEIDVEYEWRPVVCTICKGVGHAAAECRRAKTKPTQAPFVSKPVTKSKGKAAVPSTPVVVTHSGPSVEIQLKTPIVWHKNGAYSMGPTPIRPIVRMSRQEVIEGACSIHTFGQQSFLEALNKTNTPKRHVKWFMHMNKVGLFGLLETKVKSLSLNCLNGVLMDGWSLSTNNRWYKGGRIWILWNPSIFQVDVLEYSAQCINMRVLEIAPNKSFCLSIMSGFNDLTGRQALCEQLGNFASVVSGPWLVCGDFSTVLAHSKRIGGNSTDAEIDEFQACVAKYELIDSPVVGSLFTWNNKQDIATRVYSSLDRVLINGEWSTQMQEMYANFLLEGDFDHTPCILMSRNQQLHHKKPFKYYNMWGKTSFYLTTLSSWWNMPFQGTKMFF